MDKKCNALSKTPYRGIESLFISKNKVLKLYEKYMTLMGILGHFIFIFQTYKIVAFKNASNVSLEGFCIAFLSIVSWLFYGILKQDKVLVTVNVFGFISSLICIIAIIIFY
jgi:MtN3 and saliva related transmembrane protein